MYGNEKNTTEVKSLSTFKTSSMKNFILFFSFLLFSHLTFSQCNQMASNFGNNHNIPMYNVTGDVTVILNSDNTIGLNLGANFATASGPDIRAFLVNSNGATNSELRNSTIASLENIELGLVGCTSCGISQNGAKSFTVNIPMGNNIEDFDKIFFYCLSFNQLWDFGSFTSFSSTNCSSILSVDDNTLNKILLYPNPAQNTVKISGHIPNLKEVNIYNTLGKTVYKQKDNFSQNIDVSSLDNGLYIMTLKTPERIVFNRFVKQ